MLTVRWLTFEENGKPFFQTQTIAESTLQHYEQAKKVFEDEFPGKELPLRFSVHHEFVKVLE
jgi:hypothetical protein